MKLNVLLSLTDILRAKYKDMVSSYAKFFNTSQGAFMGVRDTYTPLDGMVDDPSKRKLARVVTTVDEKFDYFIQESKQFIDALFAQERTNAMGVATAELKIGDESWGIFTSLELLRLKSLLDSNDIGSFEAMLLHIPTRSDAVIWNKSTDEEYKEREIYATELVEGEQKSTVKEEYILPDPNVAAGKVTNYTPKVAQRTSVITVGNYTHQSFSGAWSHRERAGALKRKHEILVAVTQALKICNEVEMQESNLKAEKIFGYIFKGE